MKKWMLWFGSVRTGNIAPAEGNVMLSLRYMTAPNTIVFPNLRACMEPIFPLFWLFSLRQRNSSTNSQLWTQIKNTKELSVFPGFTLTHTALQNHAAIWPGHKALLGWFSKYMQQSATYTPQRDLNEVQEIDKPKSCFLFQLMILLPWDIWILE